MSAESFAEIRRPRGQTSLTDTEWRAARFPGAILREFYHEMAKKVRRPGSQLRVEEGLHPEDLMGVGSTFLTGAFLPSLRREISMDVRREMLTIMEAVDAIMAGNPTSAAEMLAQHFRAHERVLCEGRPWTVAGRLELVPGGRVSTLTSQTRGEALRLAREEYHLREGYISRDHPRGRGGKGQHNLAE